MPVILSIVHQALLVLTAFLAIAGMGYFIAAIFAARVFVRRRDAGSQRFSPGVTILKSLKGLDPGMLDGLRR